MNNFLIINLAKHDRGGKEGRGGGPAQVWGSDTVKIVFFLQLYKCMMYLKVRIKLFILLLLLPPKSSCLTKTLFSEFHLGM